MQNKVECYHFSNNISNDLQACSKQIPIAQMHVYDVRTYFLSAYTRACVLFSIIRMHRKSFLKQGTLQSRISNYVAKNYLNRRVVELVLATEFHDSILVTNARWDTVNRANAPPSPIGTALFVRCLLIIYSMETHLMSLAG